MSAQGAVLTGPWRGYFLVFAGLHGLGWSLARIFGASSPLLKAGGSYQAAHMASHCGVQFLGFLFLTLYGCSLWHFRVRR